MKKFKLFANDIAIDLGTANIRVYKTGQGVVLNEPSLVAIELKTGQVISYGKEALQVYGKTPENVTVVKPLEAGVISDFEITKILIDHCMKVSQPEISLFPPKALITAQSGITDIEIRAIEDACIQSGISEVYIVESTLSDAIGAGIQVDRADGNLIVDFGAGSTEIAIISLNGIVSSKTLNYGGDFFNKKIIEYVHEKYSLIIGQTTAENLKTTIGKIGEIEQNDCMEISGRDVMSGMPVSVDIFATDVKEAIISYIFEIIDSIRMVLEKNPPDLAKDIIRNGIYITGGGSNLRGLQDLIAYEIGIKVKKSKHPYLDTIKGAGEMIENLENFKIIGRLQ